MLVAPELVVKFSGWCLRERNARPGTVMWRACKIVVPSFEPGQPRQLWRCWGAWVTPCAAPGCWKAARSSRWILSPSAGRANHRLLSEMGLSDFTPGNHPLAQAKPLVIFSQLILSGWCLLRQLRYGVSSGVWS